jgi:hypothetical protein
MRGQQFFILQNLQRQTIRHNPYQKVPPKISEALFDLKIYLVRQAKSTTAR